MLRVLRRRAPGEWQQRHTALADHYQSTRDALGLSGRDVWKDDRWQDLAIEEHYHRLCAHTTSAIPAAQACLIDVLVWHKTSVPVWTQMIEQAGRDTEAHTVLTCGKLLSRWSDEDTDNQLCVLSDLAADTTLDDQHRSIAYRERGRIYSKLGRYEEALADFTRAIDLDSKSSGAIAHRGETYRQMKRYEEALADLTRAIDLDESGWTYYQMALVSFARDRDHDARQQLQRALVVEREKMLTSQGGSWRGFNVAVYLMALGARDQAREQVRESLERGASIQGILDAIRDFEDLQVATGSDVSEILRTLRTSLHRLQADEPPAAPRRH
jgi:tetratricopeptide (TPR) repeat protein